MNIDRLSTSARITGAAALIGALTAFLGWYSYTSGGTTTVTVNAFRASLFGDVYFLGTSALVLMIAAEAGLLALPGRFTALATRQAAALVAGAAVILQILLSLDSGQSLHKGIGIAVLCAAGMVAGTRMDRAPRRVIRAAHGIDLE